MNDESTPKFVIDSNVLLDAYTTINSPSQGRVDAARNVIDKALQCGVLLISKATKRDFDEAIKYHEKLGNISPQAAGDAMGQVEAITRNFYVPKGYIDKNREELEKCKDGNDWPFLILADSADAIIVTRDKDLLDMNYKDVVVLSPQQFMRLSLRGRPEEHE